MKMILNIYKNNEIVNTIKSDDNCEIYKTVAQILYAKETKRATKTKIDYINNTLKVVQVFDQYKTQMENVTYKYNYEIDDICL